MASEQPHELRVMNVISRDDDASSIASFEELPRRPMAPPMPLPIPHQQVLKVEGKVPDVLYVLKYIGWHDNIVEYRHSTLPFKDVPEFEGDSMEATEFDPNEKPVIEITTKVFTQKRAVPRSRRVPRGRQIPNNDRPITECFEHVQCPFDDYYSEEEQASETLPPELARPFMTIHSSHLIHALQAVISYYPYINLQGKTVSINSPYRVLYHHRKELAHYRDNQPATHSTEYASITAQHIDVLLGFLEKNLGEEIRQEEERHMLKNPMATFDYFWLLLKPGSVFYAKRYDVWTPFVISSVNLSQEPQSAYDMYRVNGWMLESNGTKVNRYMYAFNVSPWIGEQTIASLSVIPAAFWPENLDAQGGLPMREKCIEIGKLYWDLLKRPTYMEYEGHLVNSGANSRHCRGPTGFMRGRVVVDASGLEIYGERNPNYMRGPGRYARPGTNAQTGPPVKDYLPRKQPHCGCEECKATRADGENSIFVGFEDLDPLHDLPPASDVFFWVISNTVPAFILGDRRWGHLSVANLKPVKTDREAFKYLVLDEEVKLTVKALSGKYANDLSNGHISPWGNDFVKNKGEGRIFLLHGAPGVGKTCTAECVAELTNRPLISLTAGDLSVDSHVVESSLSYFLELGQRYGALVLLDEADVYLERRQPKDIHRNGLVSVFLRALEYYRGVLFLTTNRVRSFDTAILSRVHVALHYKSLRDEDRERIWAQNFDRLSRDSQGRIHVSIAARDYVWNSSEVRALRWNGREIRNAMQTALALAESNAQEDGEDRIMFSEKHLRAVVKMSRGFRDYMTSLDSLEIFESDADADVEDEIPVSIFDGN